MKSFRWFVPDQCIYSSLIITCKNTTWHEQSNVRIRSRNELFDSILTYQFVNHVRTRKRSPSIERISWTNYLHMMLNENFVIYTTQKMQLNSDFYTRSSSFWSSYRTKIIEVGKRERERTRIGEKKETERKRQWKIK